MANVEINFEKYCPILMDKKPRRPVKLSFSIDDPDVLASETGCTEGGLPGAHKITEKTFLVPVNKDRVVISCEGCAALKKGFAKDYERDEIVVFPEEVPNYPLDNE